MGMLRKAMLGLGALLLSAATSFAAADGPVAKITQVEGDVQYSRNGTDWYPITRNKYLFEGYTVRSGYDGSAKVLNQVSGVTHDLGGSTTIAVVGEDVELVAGSNFSDPEEAGGSFWQALLNKFASSQRYTTVRRGAEEKLINLPRDQIAASGSFPELVWTNVGGEYAYRLTIDGETYSVAPASTAEMVRFALPPLTAGEHSFSVVPLLDGEVDASKIAARSPEHGKLVWLDDAAEAAVLSDLKEIRNDPLRNDAFVIADYLESNDLLVPAMDTYRDYFAANPQDNDLRAFLINAYRELGLMDLRHNEALSYQAILTQEAAERM